MLKKCSTPKLKLAVFCQFAQEMNNEQKQDLYFQSKVKGEDKDTKRAQQKQKTTNLQQQQYLPKS